MAHFYGSVFWSAATKNVSIEVGAPVKEEEPA